MRAFIVRPFGVKNGIDFEKVDRELISPALDRLEMTGRTTMEIARAGNIRADMFNLLLTADIVVADISVHNANVFYELGVRHALRDRSTFLLRASIDEVPFDLKTDRYLTYPQDDPKAALEALVNGLAETKRKRVVDSPVYSMLPGLPAPDPSAFIVVPEDFREEVTRARLNLEKGDLRFLASELTGLPWRREGMRVVGEAQFKLGDMKYASETWEWVRTELPEDLQANLRLGTIYQKLGDLVRSDEALNRTVKTKGISSADLAEARALLGSNAKIRWLADWKAQADIAGAQTEALRSPFLLASLDEYRRGFETDPSHYYSGLNALAMATMLCELAAAQEDVWRERYEDEDEAVRRLKDYGNLRSQLIGAVEFSLRAQKQRLEREERKDPWLALSFADYGCLVGKANVKQLYRDALAGLDPFAEQVARKQIEMFGKLGCLPKQVEAVAPLFGVPGQGALTKVPKILLFHWTPYRRSGPGETSFPREPGSHRTRRDLQDGQGGDGRKPGAGDRDCRRRKRRGSFVSGSVRRTRHRAADVPRDPPRRVRKSIGRAVWTELDKPVQPPAGNSLPAGLTSNPRLFRYGFRTGRIMVSGSGQMPGCFIMRWRSAEPTRP